jgi:hypothetical protein
MHHVVRETEQPLKGRANLLASPQSESSASTETAPRISPGNGPRRNTMEPRRRRRDIDNPHRNVNPFCLNRQRVAADEAPDNSRKIVIGKQEISGRKRWRDLALLQRRV